MNENNTAVLEHPFHRFCGLELVSQGEGQAVCRFPVDENTANPGGVLHGGILYAMVDVTSYLAVLPLLVGENAVSHDVHVSVLRPVSKGRVVEIRAAVARKGRSVAFIRCEAYDGDKLIALGTVTKSVIARQV